MNPYSGHLITIDTSLGTTRAGRERAATKGTPASTISIMIVIIIFIINIVVYIAISFVCNSYYHYCLYHY